MRIDEFKATVSASGGLALPNLYKVILPPMGSATSDDLNMICSSVSLPGRQINTIEYPMGTTTKKIANGFGVNDINLTFRVMNDHKITKYFDEWQGKAHNQEEYTVGYYDDYTFDVEIQQLQKGTGFSAYKKQLGFLDSVPTSIKNRLPDLGLVDLSQGEIDIALGNDSRKVRVVKLKEAHCTSVNEIQLADGAIGITELSVQLSFKDWETGEADAVNNNFGDAILGGILELFS